MTELEQFKQDYMEDWSSKNPEIAEKRDALARKREAIDKTYFYYKRLQSRMFTFLKWRPEIKYIQKVLNCTPEFLLEHLGEHEEEMDLDHIIPCDRFELTDEEQFMVCNNLCNLRMMSESENKSRKNNLIQEDVDLFISNCEKFKQFNVLNKFKVLDIKL